MKQQGIKHRAESRRAKLPPLLEIDDDGVWLNDIQGVWAKSRWSSDDDGPGIEMGEWPMDAE